MMRRGCRVLFVHFHSYPILSRASQEKARELARAAHAVPVRLAALPGPVRRDPAARRAGRRAAAAGRDLPPADDAHRRAIAREHRAQALVTGEVVGQVASQTLENLTPINEVVSLPVLRPLDRHGQGRDHRGGAAPRHVSDLDHSRTRTAARCSRRATRRRKRSADDVERRGRRRCRSRRSWPRRSPRRSSSISISRVPE